MVAGLAFLATAVATLFALATVQRWSRTRAPHQGAWAVALASFALASAALATGEATGWDDPTFRAFFLFGAIVNVPWLGLGSVALLTRGRAAAAGRAALLAVTGFAAGVMVTTTIDPSVAAGGGIPAGRDHLEALPRILAAVGSGVGAVVVFTGAVWSAVRYARTRRVAGAGRLAAGNALVAAGVLVLSVGGILAGTVGEDTAFAASLAIGISVIYAGFAVAPARSGPDNHSP